MSFPIERPRRLRQSAALRRMVAETRLAPEQLIQPVFAVAGENIVRPIASLPDVHHYSIDRLIPYVREVAARGVSAVLLFGVPEKKDAHGSEAASDDGVVQRAIRALREAVPDMIVMSDVCLCAYTDHGHCGVPVVGRQSPEGQSSVVSRQSSVKTPLVSLLPTTDDRSINNDETLPLLANVALSHARAGAQVVAPSDMMDGRVGAIRSALDREKFHDVLVMSYAVKYASAFYGPFRAAQDSTPQWGDRRSYQMDCANGREALREVRLDVEEGADLVMIKPALPYLDVIVRVRAAVDVPVVAYQVSGEYAMQKLAAAHGLVDERAVMMESLLAMRRAGADLIITYAASAVAEWLA